MVLKVIKNKACNIILLINILFIFILVKMEQQNSNKKISTIISILTKNTSLKSVFYVITPFSKSILNTNNLNEYVTTNLPLKNFTHINKLSIQNSQISMIIFNLFDHYRNLEYINLCENVIYKIEYSGNSKLIYMGLCTNLLSEIDLNKIIYFFPNILILDLSYNKINKIFFPKQSSQLLVLNLKENLLSSQYINAQTMFNMPLKTLILDNNPLGNLEIPFSLNKSINLLSLSNTTTHNVSEPFKLNLVSENIKFLDLSHNLLPNDYINAQTFQNLTRLMHINMRGIKLYDKLLVKDENDDQDWIISKMLKYMNSIYGLLSMLRGLNMGEIPMESRLKWIDISHIQSLNDMDICILLNLNQIDGGRLIRSSNQRKLFNKEMSRLQTKIKMFGNWLRGVALNGTVLVLPSYEQQSKSGNQTAELWDLVKRLAIRKKLFFHEDGENHIVWYRKVWKKLWQFGLKIKIAMNADPGNTVISNELFDTQFCKNILKKELGLADSNDKKGKRSMTYYENERFMNVISNETSKSSGANEGRRIFNFKIKSEGRKLPDVTMIDETPPFANSSDRFRRNRPPSRNNQERLFVKLKSKQDILLKCPDPDENKIQRYWDFFKTNHFAFKYLQKHSIRSIDPTWLAVQPIEIINESPLEAPLTLYDIPVVSQIAKMYYHPPLRGESSHQDDDLGDWSSAYNDDVDGDEYGDPVNIAKNLGKKLKEFEKFKFISDNLVNKAVLVEAQTPNLSNASYTRKNVHRKLTITLWYKDIAVLPLLKASIYHDVKSLYNNDGDSDGSNPRRGGVHVNFTTESDHFKIKDEKNLLIKSLERSHAGLYSCYHLDLVYTLKEIGNVVSSVERDDNLRRREHSRNVTADTIQVTLIRQEMTKAAEFVVFLGDDFFIQLWRNGVLLALSSAIGFLILTCLAVYLIKFVRMCQCIRARAADRKFTEIVRELQQQTYKEIDNLRTYYMNQLNKIKDNCLNTLEGVGQSYTAYVSSFNARPDLTHINITNLPPSTASRPLNFVVGENLLPDSKDNNYNLQEERLSSSTKTITTYIFYTEAAPPPPPSLETDDQYNQNMNTEENNLMLLNHEIKSNLLEEENGMSFFKGSIGNDEEEDDGTVNKEDRWYYTQIHRLKDYTAFQIEKLVESYGTQVERLNAFTYAQLEKVRSQYKISAKNIADMIEMINLDNCRNFPAPGSDTFPAPFNIHKTLDGHKSSNGGQQRLSGAEQSFNNDMKFGIVPSAASVENLGLNLTSPLKYYNRIPEERVKTPILLTTIKEDTDKNDFLELYEQQQQPCCSNNGKQLTGINNNNKDPTEIIVVSPSTTTSKKTSTLKNKWFFKNRKKRKKKRSSRENFMMVLNQNGNCDAGRNLNSDPFFHHSRMVIKTVREKASAQLASAAYQFNNKLCNQSICPNISSTWNNILLSNHQTASITLSTDSKNIVNGSKNIVNGSRSKNNKCMNIHQIATSSHHNNNNNEDNNDTKSSLA